MQRQSNTLARSTEIVIAWRAHFSKLQLLQNLEPKNQMEVCETILPKSKPPETCYEIAGSFLLFSATTCDQGGSQRRDGVWNLFRSLFKRRNSCASHFSALEKTLKFRDGLLQQFSITITSSTISKVTQFCLGYNSFQFWNENVMHFFWMG